MGKQIKISKKWFTPTRITLLESKSGKHYNFRATVLVWDKDLGNKWSIKSRNGARYNRKKTVEVFKDAIDRNKGIPVMYNHIIEGPDVEQLGIINNVEDTDAGMIVEGKLNGNMQRVTEEIVPGFLNNVSLQVDALKEEVDEGDDEDTIYASPTDVYETSFVNVQGVPGANLMDMALAEAVKDSKKEAVDKIGCIDCDEANTVQAWKKNKGRCPKCGGYQGVKEALATQQAGTVFEVPGEQIKDDINDKETDVDNSIEITEDQYVKTDKTEDGELETDAYEEMWQEACGMKEMQDYRDNDGEADYDAAANYLFGVDYGSLDANKQRKVESEVRKSMKYYSESATINNEVSEDGEVDDSEIELSEKYGDYNFSVDSDDFEKARKLLSKVSRSSSWDWSSFDFEDDNDMSKAKMILKKNRIKIEESLFKEAVSFTIPKSYNMWWNRGQNFVIKDINGKNKNDVLKKLNFKTVSYREDGETSYWTDIYFKGRKLLSSSGSDTTRDMDEIINDFKKYVEVEFSNKEDVTTSTGDGAVGVALRGREEETIDEEDTVAMEKEWNEAINK